MAKAATKVVVKKKAAELVHQQDPDLMKMMEQDAEKGVSHAMDDNMGSARVQIARPLAIIRLSRRTRSTLMVPRPE